MESETDSLKIHRQRYRHVLDTAERASRRSPRIAFFSSLALTLATTLVALFPVNRWLASASKPTVQDHVVELRRIQSSLEDLQKYVEQQQKDIRLTSEQLDSLSKQKGDVENALSIDRPKMEALLSAINKESVKSRWIEWALSFILGVLSSLTAAFGYEWIRKRNANISMLNTKNRE